MDSVTPPTARSVRIIRRRGALDLIDDRRVRHAVDTGTWVRVVPGVFVRGDDWSRLTPIERHRIRVTEGIARIEAPTVLSHRGAGAVWGIDTLGVWPQRVEITIERATGGRTSGLIRRYALGLDALERVSFGAHEITTPAQTALDLARTLPFAEAVAAVDQALWARRPGGPLTSRDEIARLLTSSTRRRGDVRAERILAFSSTGAANVRESQMRVLVVALGFPEPRVQEMRVLASGRTVYGDLYFPDHDHWVEIDGRGKYLSPEFGAERSPAAIVIDEKNRENEIRREVRGFSRLEATDADDPRQVYDILTSDGLPSRLPRP